MNVPEFTLTNGSQRAVIENISRTVDAGKHLRQRPEASRDESVLVVSKVREGCSWSAFVRDRVVAQV